MCNPRRVRVTASRALAEAWEHEVRRVISRSGDVTAEARTREVLDASIGAPTLAVLERILAGAEGWDRDGDTFTHQLDGGYVAYHADTQELEIVARATGLVNVEVSSSDVVRGDLAQTIEVEGVGTYYDDEWGGITEDDARAAAQTHAEDQLRARRRELLDEARAVAEGERGAAVESAAGLLADEELVRRTADRERELRAEATNRLTSVGIQGRNVFHRALALAYRDAILAYAQSRGAEGLTCTERDGVVEIQFEMRA
jgi:hypothetical protein